MDKSIDSSKPEQGLEFWENEVSYYETSMEGMRMAYAMLSSMHEHAKKRVADLTPDREEVLQ